MTGVEWDGVPPLAEPVHGEGRHLTAALSPSGGPYEVRRVRCACHHCGAHTMAPMCFTLGGGCQTCGSLDIRPIPERSSDR